VRAPARVEVELAVEGEGVDVMRLFRLWRRTVSICWKGAYFVGLEGGLGGE
jgi:hypothetical protein